MEIASHDAEQCVIGAILLNPSIASLALDVLQKEDFFARKHRDIFGAIADMQSAQVEIDEITLAQYMQSHGLECDMSYLIELSNSTPSYENVCSYAKIVKECARKRALSVALMSAVADVHEDTAANSDDLIARTAAMIGNLQCADGEGVRNTKELMKALSRKWDRRSQMDGEIDGLETGLKVLDERYMGLKPGDLVILAGRPSMGKSVLAMQIAQHTSVIKGLRSKVFSLEMSAEALIERATANLGNIHLNVFRRCTKADFGAHQNQIIAAAQKIADASDNLLIDETPQLHINQIMARARNAHRKGPLSLIVVDHINIARGDGQNREREIASITGGLKALAKELNCVVIAVTQLNRDVEKRADKRPVMSDTRDSGSIEQDADIVLLLYRDEYYNPDSYDKGIIELITGKMREGETGVDGAASLLYMAKIADLDRRWERSEPEPPVRGFKPYAAS